MTLPALMVGVLLGGIGAAALLNDELRHRDEELKALLSKTHAYRQECPAETIKVVTQTINSDPVVRCVGRGRVKAM